jgi:hypothetical protein
MGILESTPGGVFQNTATSGAGGLGLLAQSNLGTSALFMTLNSAGANTYATVAIRNGAAGATADLTQWQANDGAGGAGATLAVVDYLGKGTFTGLKTNGVLEHKVKSIVFADSPYTAAGETVILSDATNGNIVVNLPTAASAIDRTYHIKKIDASANTITVTPNGVETIDGAATYVINVQYNSIQIVSDGSQWFII